MARQKTYNTKEIIGLINEYKLLNPGLEVTIPKFGAYIRGKGYSVEDHTLRRDSEIRDYLKAVNKKEEKNIYKDLVTYRTLDVDAFLANNKTKAQLKEAIMMLDKYYANIASRAADAIKEKNKKKEQVDQLENKAAKLKEEIKRQNLKIEEAKKTIQQLKEKNNIILNMKNILEDYVYPDVANALLKKEGILEVINSIVDDETIEQKTIQANTDITDVENNSEISKKKSKFSAVNSLLGDFDE